MDKEEKRDTSGDTKVFQVRKREDIEREKRRQAIEKEKISVANENVQAKSLEKRPEKRNYMVSSGEKKLISFTI